MLKRRNTSTVGKNLAMLFCGGLSLLLIMNIFIDGATMNASTTRRRLRKTKFPFKGIPNALTGRVHEAKLDGTDKLLQLVKVNPQEEISLHYCTERKSRKSRPVYRTYTNTTEYPELILIEWNKDPKTRCGKYDAVIRPVIKVKFPEENTQSICDDLPAGATAVANTYFKDRDDKTYTVSICVRKDTDLLQRVWYTIDDLKKEHEDMFFSGMTNRSDFKEAVLRFQRERREAKEKADNWEQLTQFSEPKFLDESPHTHAGLNKCWMRLGTLPMDGNSPDRTGPFPGSERKFVIGFKYDIVGRTHKVERVCTYLDYSKIDSIEKKRCEDCDEHLIWVIKWTDKGKEYTKECFVEREDCEAVTTFFVDARLEYDAMSDNL